MARMCFARSVLVVAALLAAISTVPAAAQCGARGASQCAEQGVERTAHALG
jgi:hypothetical protein